MKAFVIKRGARLGAGRIKLPSGREAEPGSPVTEEDVFEWRRWSCVFSNLGGTADSMLFVLSWCFTGLGLFYWLKKLHNTGKSLFFTGIWKKKKSHK